MITYNGKESEYIYIYIHIYNVVYLLSHIQLCATLWTVAHQTPLSMEFSRQEYWSGLQWPPPVDLSNAGIKPTSLTSPALAGSFFTTGVGFYFFSRGSFQPRDWIHVSCIGRWILYPWVTSSVQLLNRVRLCDSMHTAHHGFLVHHQLLELAETHVHRVSDDIQPSSKIYI